jgi:RimJ/RimL family protein N-acetyltransferase
MIVLETERLAVRRITEDDAASFLEMERDPEVLRHVGRKPLADVEAYRQKIRTVYMPWYDRPGGYGPWVILEKRSGEFLGGCSLCPALESHDAADMGYGPGEVEIGYGLRRASWGRGYATELVRALVHRALVELGAARVVACVSVANAASIRVLEKAGLRRAEGLFHLEGDDVGSLKYVLEGEVSPCSAGE